MHKILAIDDNMDNLITLSALLNNLVPRCAVITAKSRMEGITKARAELPDVILLDIKMHEMDGFETCRRLMADENTKRIPVIMITDIQTNAGSRIKGLECGAHAFLSMPIDEVELVSQVKVALRIKKAEDTLRKQMDSLEKVVQERTAVLRRTNEFLTSIFENIPNMIFIKSAGDLRFVGVNRAGEDLLGHLRKDLLGKNDYDFFPKEQADFFTERDRRALCGKKLVDIPEEYIQARSEGEIILHTKKVPILNKNGEPEYLLGISEDITERKRAEGSLRETAERLRKNLIGAIQAMSLMVETKDPYTAGRQRRVSAVARAIAQEMGLSSGTVDTIRMAGTIHDIGKISVPSEILSKPGALSDMEFSLIKTHVQAGYDILKDVELPYPIAEIVLQHHERLDGSGYPEGLKDGQILLEAKILSVADVVEAMTSHRPYRPALGIEAALEEIEKNKDILYDAEVAEACVKLFREKGFHFE